MNPLETAPRDGRWIMGYWPGATIEDDMFQCMRWRAEPDGKGCWLTAWDGTFDPDDTKQRDAMPTHWWPLPERPVLQKSPETT